MQRAPALAVYTATEVRSEHGALSWRLPNSQPQRSPYRSTTVPSSPGPNGPWAQVGVARTPGVGVLTWQAVIGASEKHPSPSRRLPRSLKPGLAQPVPQMLISRTRSPASTMAFPGRRHTAPPEVALKQSSWGA